MRKVLALLEICLIAALGLQAVDKSLYAEGEDLFRRCSPCHGPYNTKQPMGKDRDITRLQTSEIATIIRNYALGRSEGAMTSQATMLDKQKIDALSTYIANMHIKYGEELFALRCSGCHGKDAKKSAFGKSGMVASLTEPELMSVLRNYQNGTYAHGSTANTMKGRAIALSENDITALARYIGTLK
ncbi:MAG: c-type cytochrome [Helicobacteraceae bacterium]|jgi:cytochrome c553|nr:c-type cytochrome [Helicobacteraceae bacterium]